MGPSTPTGCRISYLDVNMRFKTHLLAIKLFRPHPKLGRKVTGELVLKWVRKVLLQFGLTIENIAGAVTDAGTDIKGALGKVVKWEWCLPHLLNRVTVDAAGLSMDKMKSKNAEVRELVDSVKKAVEHFNKSDASKV